MAKLSELRKAIDDFIKENGDGDIMSFGTRGNSKGFWEHIILLKDDSDDEIIIAVPMTFRKEKTL